MNDYSVTIIFSPIFFIDKMYPIFNFLCSGGKNTPPKIVFRTAQQRVFLKFHLRVHWYHFYDTITAAEITVENLLKTDLEPFLFFSLFLTHSV